MFNPNKPYIIAEVGSNWNRYPFEGMMLALRHIDDAAMSGANAVKFQLFTYKELYGIDTKNEADKIYELPRKWIPILQSYAKLRQIDFMCSAFSPEGYRFINQFVEVHKIASSESMDKSIIDAATATRKPVLISCGGQSPQETIQLSAYVKDKNVKLLTCVAKYPAKDSDYSIEGIGRVFHGISDHTLSTGVALSALGRGSLIFEKHFDCLGDVISNGAGPPPRPSPDSAVSVGPAFLGSYIKLIHSVFETTQKKPNKDSKFMGLRWKRRLMMIKNTGSFEELREGINFGSFRSLNDDTKGGPPWHIKEFEGKRIKRELKAGDGVYFDDLA